MKCVAHGLFFSIPTYVVLNFVIEIVGKIFDTENLRIKGNSNEQVKLCDKYLLSDYKIR